MGFLTFIGDFTPTKNMLAWTAGGACILTMAVGFTVGGWVTGASAGRMAQEAATSAYTKLAGTVCAAHFVASTDAGAEREELLALASYKQRAFIQEQHWALMPDETSVTRPVAELCARKIAEMDPNSFFVEEAGNLLNELPAARG